MELKIHDTYEHQLSFIGVVLNGKAILHLTEKQFASALQNPSCHFF